jgi:F0F1-type ATP synthase gamma subunit
VILVSTDKGLCGALNSNLFREAGKFDKDTTVSSPPAEGRAIRRAHQTQARGRVHLQGRAVVREARAISKFARTCS